MSTLLLVPLDDIVVFPNMNVTISVDVGDEERVLLVPRHEGEYAKVGTVAEVGERVRLPGGGRGGQPRRACTAAAPGAAQTDPQGRLRVEVEERPDEEPPRRQDPRARARVPRRWSRRSSSCAATTAASPPSSARSARSARSPTPPPTRRRSPSSRRSSCSRRWTSSSGSSSRSRLQRERLAELQVRRRIRDDVEEGAAKQQREYILRRQMESIRKELGEDDALGLGRLPHEDRRGRACPTTVREQAEREVGRLERMGDQSGESSMIRTYLDWLLAVPWGKRSEERLDPVHAREVLDADHAGLEDVKDRIVEYLAVRKLRQERGIAEDKRSGAILTLIGPPGTGKTSVGESIARALNREFVRMSLGGVRDEAEIRGHRRTYIGALPGRLVRALRDAGTMNPVILLDEVDKVGADWRGDPSAALLEVLDPAQNHSFRDHYLDVELDLSEVIFIATANIAETIPGPAARPHGGDPLRRLHGRREGRDRPRLPVAAPARAGRPARGRGVDRRRHARADRQPVHPRGRRPPARARARQAAAQDGDDRRLRHSRGADRDRRGGGPRRARASSASTRSRPSARPCPAWPPASPSPGTGGDVLFVEATRMQGKDGLVLTGQLGDVMKESARIALSYVRSHAERARPRRARLRGHRASTCTCLRARSRRTARAPGSR